MKKFFRIFGYCVILTAFCLLALRGLMGISFVMGDKDFYPPAGYFLEPQEQEVRFAILSDTGSQNWTLERLVMEIRTNEKPNFMLHLGDLVVYRNIEHMYWIMDELDDKLAGIPMYLVPGNHDVKKKKGINKSMYQRVFGQTYYWFGYGNTLFIALDSSTEEIDDAQWAFFENVMKRIRPSFKHVVLYTHVPPIVPPEHHQHSLKAASVEKMGEMLKRYPVSAIFAGHVHYYSEQQFQGIPVYTVPPSGQYFGGPVHKFGYLMVTINQKGVHVQNVFSNRKKSAELLEVLFVDLVLSNKVRWISGGILIVGLCLLLFGQKWLWRFFSYLKNK